MTKRRLTPEEFGKLGATHQVEMSPEELGFKDGKLELINGRTFDRWLTECAEIAMRTEWMIEPTMPEWEQWWRLGMTPADAVERLFQLVREQS